MTRTSSRGSFVKNKVKKFEKKKKEFSKSFKYNELSSDSSESM